MRLSTGSIALAIGALIVGAAAIASAEPIMKPRKYHGPIPQSWIWVRGGMMGDASNAEMNDYLDARIQPPFIANSDDFGTSLVLEAGYGYKPHPQFGFRLNASLTLLRSEGNGTIVPQVPGVPDSVPLPVVDYTRKVESDLIVMEASGVYFFSDAAVKEFQTYLGGGFSVGLPHESYHETQVDADSGSVFQTIDSSEWGVAAGVHAVLGAIYYVTNTMGVSVEGRLQMMEGRYDKLQAPNEVGDFEDVSFIVDYTGFFLTVGMLWGF